MMSQNNTLTYHFSSPVEDGLDQYLSDGISALAFKKRGLAPLISHSYALKNEVGEFKGGVEFYLNYGGIYISWLYVEKAYHGQGYGGQLMQRVETFAKEKGTRFIDVCTMDFEALDFYKKHGYVVDFERHGFDGGSILYFMRKKI
ncbi:MAG: GNAT family N-acetyltransferase [Alphaproteobacteria bacterium]|nr:GNAT family N-acetyltransferase [Alphaproteobacteria bacterium]